MPDEEPALELRKEWTRLRAIMYETTCVRLSTAVADGGRWLTDEYVLLDVTDSPAVEGLEDGAYKLTAGKGFVRLYWEHKDVNDGEPTPRPSEFDADTYFGKLADAWWKSATPSEWSVAEHPGKAMLFRVDYRPFPGEPALMGEETWGTLRKRFVDARAEYATGIYLNVFRIIDGDVVVAYVAGIRIPDGQADVARAIVAVSQGRGYSPVIKVDAA